MHISQKQVEAYDKVLSAEQRRVLKLFDELYKQGKAIDSTLDVAGLRELAISSIHESLEVFGGAASEHALEFIEDTAGADTTDIEYHELDDETKHRIDRYVHSKAQHLVDGDEESFVELCKQILETEVHESANRTMRKAADKLGLRYARVPMGGETCGFCLMLASRGFVYTSKESAGDGAHYHTHCRCKVVAGKKGDKVEGYDPEALYKEYKCLKQQKEQLEDGTAIITRDEYVQIYGKKFGARYDEISKRLRGVKLGEPFFDELGVDKNNFKEVGLVYQLLKEKNLIISPDDTISLVDEKNTQRDLIAYIRLVEQGKHVVNLPEPRKGQELGEKDIDAIIDGKLTEIKSPLGSSKSSAKDAFKSVIKKFNNLSVEDKRVAFNTEYSNNSDKLKYQVKKCNESDWYKDVIVTVI